MVHELRRLPSARPGERPQRHQLILGRLLGGRNAGVQRCRWVLALCLSVLPLLGIAAGLAYYEARTSALQARLLSRYVAKVTYAVESGSSPAIAFPLGGPFDQRRGYSLIPEFQDRLRARGYRVVEQARQSAQMTRLMELGITPPYRETAAAGLLIRAEGVPLHDARPRQPTPPPASRCCRCRWRERSGASWSAWSRRGRRSGSAVPSPARRARR